MQLSDEERSYEDAQLQFQAQTKEQNDSNSNFESLTPISHQSVESSTWLRFWRWTGIGEKTLLDLIQLAVAIAASIAIPITIAMIGYRQEQSSIEQQVQQQKLAEDNQRHQILSAYLDRMTQLLLEKKLGDSNSDSQTRFVARAGTLNTLRQLDGGRKGELLKFLYEAGLIGGKCTIDPKTLEANECQDPILNLNDARLDETTFERPIPLQGVDLSNALLSEAKLQGINLSKAEMQDVTLSSADLTKATLADAQMERATLTSTSFVDAILPRANLAKAILRGSDLRGANLEQAVLTGAELQEANLSNATLANASLQDAKLKGANLDDANLQGADLRNADLMGVSLQDTNLKGAMYNTTTQFPEGFSVDGKGMIISQ